MRAGPAWLAPGKVFRDTRQLSLSNRTTNNYSVNWSKLDGRKQLRRYRLSRSSVKNLSIRYVSHGALENGLKEGSRISCAKFVRKIEIVEKSGNNRATMEAVEYLAKHKNDKKVQELLCKVGIDAEGFTWPVTVAFRGLFLPMMRLAHMGLDTDENLALLFGDPRVVRDVQRDVRIGVLLGAPRGSPSFNIGMRGANETDPDVPASEIIMRLLPDWVRDLTDAENGQACGICMHDLTSPVQSLPGCLHVFHPKCIRNWLRRKSTCPVCRTALPIVAPRPATDEEMSIVDQVRKIQFSLQT